MLALLLASSLPALADWRADLAPAGEGDPVERALVALEGVPGLSDPVVLEAAGGYTVRFDQRVSGLPVLHAGAAVRVLADGAVPAARVNVYTHLEVDPTPSLSVSQARLAAELPDDPAIKGRLIVLPFGEGVLAWELLTPDTYGSERVRVDAHSGALLGRSSVIVDAVGRVYAENPIRTPQTSDVELELLDEGDKLNGWGGNLRVTNVLSGNSQGQLTLGQSLSPNAGDDYLYDPPSDPLDFEDGFAQVSTYHHITRARSYYSELANLDMSGRTWRLTAAANGSSGGGPLDNAYFNPSGQSSGEFAAPNLIVIGQGSQVDFALDADVFVHEFGHYVSQNAIGYNQGQFGVTEYGLAPWTGSMDEGIADYFAVSLFDDPVLGEVSLEPLGAERDLSANLGRCPDTIIGEVHEDGKLIGSLGWALREAYGQQAADQIVWGALTMMSSGSDLGDFASAVTQLGDELAASGDIENTDALLEALEERGLDRCGVVQDLNAGSFTTIVLGLDLLAGGFGVDCATAASLADLQSVFHFKLDTDETAEGVRFQVDLQALGGGGDLSWRLYLREGEHVTFGGGFFLPEIDEYDIESETFTEATGEVIIEGEDFTPGQTWYGVLVSDNCPLTEATFTGEVFEPDEPQDSLLDDSGDAGGDDTGGETLKGSCACDGGAVSGSWLGLLGLALLRRRRR